MLVSSCGPTQARRRCRRGWIHESVQFSEVESDKEKTMSLRDAIVRMVQFARGGYPHGVPATDRFAVLAVMPPARATVCVS